MWGAPVDKARARHERRDLVRSSRRRAFAWCAPPCRCAMENKSWCTGRRAARRTAGAGPRAGTHSPVESHLGRDPVLRDRDAGLRRPPVTSHSPIEPGRENRVDRRRSHRAQHPWHGCERRTRRARSQLRHAARPREGIHDLFANARHQAVARAAHAADHRQLIAGQPGLRKKPWRRTRRATWIAPAVARIACTPFSPR